MLDRFKKGLFAIGIIAIIGLIGNEEMEDERNAERFYKCLEQTDRTDSDCDSCNKLIYGSPELYFEELYHGK